MEDSDSSAGSTGTSNGSNKEEDERATAPTLSRVEILALTERSSELRETVELAEELHRQDVEAKEATSTACTNVHPERIPPPLAPARSKGATSTSLTDDLSSRPGAFHSGGTTASDGLISQVLHLRSDEAAQSLPSVRRNDTLSSEGDTTIYFDTHSTATSIQVDSRRSHRTTNEEVLLEATLVTDHDHDDRRHQDEQRDSTITEAHPMPETSHVFRNRAMLGSCLFVAIGLVVGLLIGFRVGRRGTSSTPVPTLAPTAFDALNNGATGGYQIQWPPGLEVPFVFNSTHKELFMQLMESETEDFAPTVEVNAVFTICILREEAPASPLNFNMTYYSNAVNVSEYPFLFYEHIRETGREEIQQWLLNAMAINVTGFNTTAHGVSFSMTHYNDKAPQLDDVNVNVNINITSTTSTIPSTEGLQ